MSPSSQAGLSSLLALLFAFGAAVGAPPSIVVEPPSVWLYLEPLMLPALLAGILGSLLGTLLAPFRARLSAIACMVGCACSMVGVSVGTLIDAEHPLTVAVAPLAFLAVPLLGAANAWRHARAHEGQNSGLSKSAG